MIAEKQIQEEKDVQNNFRKLDEEVIEFIGQCCYCDDSSLLNIRFTLLNYNNWVIHAYKLYIFFQCHFFIIFFRNIGRCPVDGRTFYIDPIGCNPETDLRSKDPDTSSLTIIFASNTFHG